MSTTAMGHRYADGPALDEQVSENVRTMMFRAGYTQTKMANAIHIGQTTLSRRLLGESSWLNWEVGRIAEHFGLDLAEVNGTLPPLSEWRERECACRDSNPKPSVLESDHGPECWCDACSGGPNRVIKLVTPNRRIRSAWALAS